jgi:hypothetical protein
MEMVALTTPYSLLKFAVDGEGNDTIIPMIYDRALPIFLSRPFPFYAGLYILS